MERIIVVSQKNGSKMVYPPEMWEFRESIDGYPEHAVVIQSEEPLNFGVIRAPT